MKNKNYNPALEWRLAMERNSITAKQDQERDKELEELYKKEERRRSGRKLTVQKLLAKNPNHFREIGARGLASMKLAKMKVENGQ